MKMLGYDCCFTTALTIFWRAMNGDIPRFLQVSTSVFIRPRNLSPRSELVPKLIPRNRRSASLLVSGIFKRTVKIPTNLLRV
ncbi:hypothetical protein PBPRA0241 [Photobacterium profundum SS9]|uniref:Uncharacterized protein n=1 Tax=Photobacterium profundum (strain SS9) TaxID=298386 RepID=Q6LVJ5_PHOPR|nr:hypothetical protein PBPRA0241 [Photobacterium profundum SS9]